MVGRTPLDGRPAVDVGRLHYDYTAYVGNPGREIADSYGEERNRCELRPGGVALFVGAGGPMGQMHVQRALELPEGPRTVIATDLNAARLDALEQLFASLARERGRRLITFNPAAGGDALRELVLHETGGVGVDDAIISVPVAALMAEAAELMRPDGMLVLFAGVPNGTLAPLNLSAVYLHNAQLTGTSGSRLADQALVIRKTVAGVLSPNRSVAAVGGIEAARDGVQAMMEGRYPGKVVIFPQISGLPLMSVAELAERYPEIGSQLGAGGVWTPEAEAALIERFWRP
jgi:threonine dehydrogenase-like Zn-dependent dehydrogenase